MKIYHQELDREIEVNDGLAGVLIEDGGWEPVDEAEYQKKVEAEVEKESGPPGISRAEALKKPKKAPAKKPPTKKKETD
jgi:hypothetical protein